MIIQYIKNKHTIHSALNTWGAWWGRFLSKDLAQQGIEKKQTPCLCPLEALPLCAPPWQMKSREAPAPIAPWRLKRTKEK